MARFVVFRFVAVQSMQLAHRSGTGILLAAYHQGGILAPDWGAIAAGGCLELNQFVRTRRRWINVGVYQEGIEQIAGVGCVFKSCY